MICIKAPKGAEWQQVKGDITAAHYDQNRCPWKSIRNGKWLLPVLRNDHC